MTNEVTMQLPVELSVSVVCTDEKQIGALLTAIEQVIEVCFEKNTKITTTIESVDTEGE